MHVQISANALVCSNLGNNFPRLGTLQQRKVWNLLQQMQLLEMEQLMRVTGPSKPCFENKKLIRHLYHLYLLYIYNKYA